MDFLPPGLFQGVGVVAIITTLLVTSWWLLMRGNIHTDTEYRFVLSQLDSRDAQIAAKDSQLKAKEEALTEALKQNSDLIQANRTITHVVEGLRVAMEAKR